MNDFERRIQEEIDTLQGPDFPDTPRAKRQREQTIRALAEAALAGIPWTGDDGVLGPKRERLVVGEKNFYAKKHWYPNQAFQEVLRAVIQIYRERDALETEIARLQKRAWLEAKEMEAAELQFAKAEKLLELPHIVKKSKPKDGEPAIILDPANAAVFNAAVRLNVSASDLARRSLGLPTDVTRSEVTGAEGGPLRTEDVGKVHDGTDHIAAVIRTLVEVGAVELQSTGEGGDAEDDEIYPASADA